jgi:hypothetical protein
MAPLSKGMVLVDANGVHALLPNGGNWAVFTDRMGLKEVSADSKDPHRITIQDPEGKVHTYVRKDGGDEGTIAAYFQTLTREFDDESKNLLAATPHALRPEYL